MKILSKKVIYSAASISFIGIVFLFWLIFWDLPKLNSMEDYKPYLINQVFDSSNNLVAEFFIERRTVIGIENLPEHVKNAFIAAEDAEFYHHKGIDYFGILRAIAAEIKYRFVGGKRIGGSTITQQTAKTMLLSRSRTYTRKLKELIVAKRMEDKLTKNEILNIYLNQIYFGHGVYGIEEAAKYYYGHGAKDLTLGQAAVLAGIPKSPNRINPVSNPVRSKARREYVLDQMAEKLFISNHAAQRGKLEPVESNHKLPKKPYLNQAPYFTEAIRKSLIDELTNDGLYRGGLKIYTTLDLRMQRDARRALRRGLKKIDKRQGYHGPQIRFKSNELQQAEDDLFLAKQTLVNQNNFENKLWDLKFLTKSLIINHPEKITEHIKYIPKQAGETLSGLVISSNDKTGKAIIDFGSEFGEVNFKSIQWARDFSTKNSYPYPKTISQILHKGDIVPLKIVNIEPLEATLYQLPKVEGTVVSIDPETHHVLALVGGYDFKNTKFNRATQAFRQPGSAFKPLLYALALDQQKVTPASLITDAPKVYFDENTGSQWKPRNDTGRFLGDITLRTCLRKSINTCSISLLEKVGVSPLIEFSKLVGIASDEKPFQHDLTLSLGSAQITPLSLVNAFTIFPNQGRIAKPILITHMTNLRDELLFDNDPDEIQVLKPETAYIMTNLMKDVIQRGTGRGAKYLSKYNIGGKTGSTNNLRSTWFIGYSPNLVTGVYVGFDSNESLGKREYAVKTALPIWAEFMSRSLPSRPVEDFREPEGIQWRLIDEKTGLLSKKSLLEKYTGELFEDEINPKSVTPPDGTILEAFIENSEPTEYSQEENGESQIDFFDEGGL